MISLPAHAIGAPPERRSAPVIFGRERERRILSEELATARAGRGRLVLLGGEAGIGKTSLARDLAREADGLGVRIAAGHCFDLSSAPPYGPWLELFRRHRADPSWPPAPAALAGGQLGPVPDQAALFTEVSHFLTELAAERPLYLLLEDLHWADPLSIELLRHVGRTIADAAILLLVTYRDDEISRQHPLARALPALVRECDAQRLEPRPLDMTALLTLVSARYRLPEADAARLVLYLEHHTDGNPFFAVELLRALEEEGLLRAGDHRSSLGELSRVVVPNLLRQVIDGRVARIGEAMRRPLEMAAVIGQEVPLTLWAALAELDDEALLATVERAADAHLLEAMRNGTHARFVHALTREAIYEGILPPRRRIWHQQVGEALAAAPNPDPDPVALHFQQAGDARAAEWLERAGERAQRAYAWHTAAERLRTAAALLLDIAGQERKHRELLFRVAMLVRFADPTSGIVALDEIERLAARSGDHVLAAEVRYFRGIQRCYADAFRVGLAEIASGVATLEALAPDTARTPEDMRRWYFNVITSVEEQDAAGEQFIADRLRAEGFDSRRCAHPWFCASGGHLQTAIAEGERFTAAFAGVANVGISIRATGAFAYHGLAIAYAALGRPAAAAESWRIAREAFRDADHHALVAFGLMNEGRDVALTYGAADPAARRRLAAEAEIALGQAGGALQTGLSPRLAWLATLLLDGRWDEADHILRELPRPNNCYFRREYTAATAELARYRGEPDAAWAEIRTLLPDGPATEPGDIIHQEGLFLQRLAAELCLDGGDLEGARGWLAAHDRWLAWSGSVLGRAEGALAWARCRQVAGDAPGARAAADAALAAEPAQPLVRLRAHRILGELARADGAPASAEAQFSAALALAERCEAPFERALTLLAQAAGREPEAAGPLLAEVRKICEPLRAAPPLARAEALAARSPARPPGTALPAGLTTREAEVLRLLAEHRMDKEIADELFISRRTVESHVANILAKLGIESRREAAAVATRLGLE